MQCQNYNSTSLTTLWQNNRLRYMFYFFFFKSLPSASLVYPGNLIWLIKSVTFIAITVINRHRCNCIKVKYETLQSWKSKCLNYSEQYFQSIRQSRRTVIIWVTFQLSLIWRTVKLDWSWFLQPLAPHLGHHHQCVMNCVYGLMTYMELVNSL